MAVQTVMVLLVLLVARPGATAGVKNDAPSVADRVRQLRADLDALQFRVHTSHALLSGSRAAAAARGPRGLTAHVGALVGWAKLALLLLNIYCIALSSAVLVRARRASALWDAGGGPVLLVTAHPDDEAMFFSPTIEALVTSGARVHLLCLSTGDAGGLGDERRAEVVASCSALGIPGDRVVVLDQPELRDGPRNRWRENDVVRAIEAASRRTNASTVLTFDGGGVTGHPNHVDVYRGVRAWVRRRAERKGRVAKGAGVHAFMLVTHGAMRRFVGPLDIPYTLAASERAADVVWRLSPISAWRAMSFHATQWQMCPYWWRRVAVVASRYSYVNTWVQIE